jgi:hypothetical protein
MINLDTSDQGGKNKDKAEHTTLTHSAEITLLVAVRFSFAVLKYGSLHRDSSYYHNGESHG